jgi:periplasmic protein TonB
MLSTSIARNAFSLEVPQPTEPVTPAVPDAPVTPAVPDPGTPADPEEPAVVPVPEEPATPIVPERAPEATVQPLISLPRRGR